MNNIKKISIEEYVSSYNKAVEIHKDKDEPIPELRTDSLGNIKYILEIPFQNVFGKVLYWGFYKKAAIQFYLMIKNHPLENGCKRMACVSLGLFFYKNERNLNLDNSQLRKLSLFVANSLVEDKDWIVKKIADILKNPTKW